MRDAPDPTVCRFFRLIPDAPAPRRADRAADGKISIDAYRYCEPLTTASAFGWHVYPPLNFSLLLDDDELFWRYEGQEDDAWIAVQGGVQYPGFRDAFAQVAPDRLKDFAPTFLAQGSSPGHVQIWSGWLAQTTPGWALLSRGVVNAQETQAYRNYEGIIETESWFGPLFTNIRLTRSNAPVYFHQRRPLFQVQPLLRECYRLPSFEVLGADDLLPADWQRFEATIRPNLDHMRHPGHYAGETRRRLRASAT